MLSVLRVMSSRSQDMTAARDYCWLVLEASDATYTEVQNIEAEGDEEEGALWGRCY
jgi:hypothetical protein